MSHLCTIATRLRDPDAVRAACRRLGLEEPVEGTALIYKAPATGLIVRLPGWSYAVVIDCAAGELQYDTYGGSWGDEQELRRLAQAYAIEKARIEARRAGHTLTEHALPDGSVRLSIQVGG